MLTQNSTTPANTAGLCSTCAHARVITSDRGSRFLLCQLSRTDKQFLKYPRLPVLTCPGYSKAQPETP